MTAEFLDETMVDRPPPARPVAGPRTGFRRAIERMELARVMGIPGDRDLAAEDLLRLFANANGDELDVLGKVWERIEYGRKLYGLWDASRDQRDFASERDAEVFDGLVYSAQKALVAR